MKMGKHRGWPNWQIEDLQERSGSEQSEISSDDRAICCDTGRLSVPGSPDHTHRHTVKHVVSQLFPHSICAKEFEDEFLNGSSTMQQQQSGCLRECTATGVSSRLWSVRLLGEYVLPIGAGRRNLRLWEGREAGWSCLHEWRIEALRLHRARCRGSAQLVPEEMSAR